MILADFRKKARITQQELALEVGVTRQMISAIEKGAKPSVSTAKSIAKVLGFDWRLFYPDDEACASAEA
jgi:transcriptional regulator with XRE-family HTH domain